MLTSIEFVFRRVKSVLSKPGFSPLIAEESKYVPQCMLPGWQCVARRGEQKRNRWSTFID